MSQVEETSKTGNIGSLERSETRREKSPEASPGEWYGEISERDTGFSEGWLYAFACGATRLFLSFFFDWRIYDAHRVPRKGPVILAPNHASFLDPLLAGDGVRRRCCFLARDTLFRVPVLGSLISAVGTYPLPRESISPRKSLELALKILEKGRVLVLFPEGTRSRDGKLGNFRKGTAWIAKRSGVPVVPVRIVGSFEAWPPHRALPRRVPLRVFYGEPVRCGPKESVDSFLDRLKAAIIELGDGGPRCAARAGVNAVSRSREEAPGSEDELVIFHASTGFAAGVQRHLLHRDIGFVAPPQVCAEA